MSTGIIDIMKRASMDAVENSKPCDLRYGTVVSVSPLKIQITPQFILPESTLVVPKHLTDYEIETTISSDYGWSTNYRAGGSDAAAFESHNHDLEHSRKKITIHGALKLGDKVALLRQSGGQSYFILDRV